MSTVAAKTMTANEFYDWANHPVRADRFFELDEGRVVEMPPPGEAHGAICGWIVYLLTTYVVQRGKGYVCSNDTGLIIKRTPATVRGPDIMLYEETRQLRSLNHKFADRMPKLIVEVLSPRDRVNVMNRKISQFLKRGVPLVWLADPESCTVTVFRPGKNLRVLQENEEITGEDVLPKLRFRVAELFRLPGE